MNRKFFVFDIDDNIIKTDTPLYMEKLDNGIWYEIVVNSEEYAKVKNLPNYRHCEKSFIEFKDFGARGANAFLEDFKTAITNNRLAPSFNQFNRCLIQGSLFALITARGHEIDTFKKAIYWYITNILTKSSIIKNEMTSNLNYYYPNMKFDKMIDAYLNDCRFYACSNDNFKEKHCSHVTEYKTEIGKICALNDFVHYLKSVTSGCIKVGFSDDDSDNLNKLNEYMKNSNFTDVEFYLIDTSKGRYVKTKIEQTA